MQQDSKYRFVLPSVDGRVLGATSRGVGRGERSSGRGMHGERCIIPGLQVRASVRQSGCGLPRGVVGISPPKRYGTTASKPLVRNPRSLGQSLASAFRTVAGIVGQNASDFLLGLRLAGNVPLQRRSHQTIRRTMNPKSKGAFMRWYLGKIERQFWATLSGDKQAAKALASEPLLPLFTSGPQLEFDFSRPYQKGGVRG